MISMKNDKIIASWNKIEPSDSANERMLSAILERNRSIQNGKDKVKYMSKTKKMLIPVAACLVMLIAVTGIVGNSLNWFGNKNDVGSNDAGFGEDIDGTVPYEVPDGMDPIVASIAVFPENERIENVEDAKLNSISEEDAYSFEVLGTHLPTVIPDGYCFRHAGVYETTMKNGMTYYRLNVSYSYGDNTFNDTEEDVLDTLDYSVSVLNYKPKTDSEVYSIDALPDDLSGKGFLYVVYGDVYVGIDVGDLTHDEIISVLNSID